MSNYTSTQAAFRAAARRYLRGTTKAGDFESERDDFLTMLTDIEESLRNATNLARDLKRGYKSVWERLRGNVSPAYFEAYFIEQVDAYIEDDSNNEAAIGSLRRLVEELEDQPSDEEYGYGGDPEDEEIRSDDKYGRY